MSSVSSFSHEVKLVCLLLGKNSIAQGGYLCSHMWSALFCWLCEPSKAGWYLPLSSLLTFHHLLCGGYSCFSVTILISLHLYAISCLYPQWNPHQSSWKKHLRIHWAPLELLSVDGTPGYHICGLFLAAASVCMSLCSLQGYLLFLMIPGFFPLPVPRLVSED